MFGVPLPVPSWHDIETLRPNPNPSQDFEPIGSVAGGLDMVRHVSSNPPISKASSSEGLVVIRNIAKAHSTPYDGQCLCGRMGGAFVKIKACKTGGLCQRSGD